MEVNQALSIIFQAIDVAVASGSFKSSRDVATVEQAKQVVAQALQGEEKEVGPGPKKVK
jgi:hypothetical protein